MVLVAQREVPVLVDLLHVHPLKSAANQYRHLIAERWVVAAATRHRAGQHLAVAIFVLQTLAVERGAARSRAKDEAACANIARQPAQVADALEAEHRVEDEEGHHRHVVRAVRGAGDDPTGHRTGLVDAFL